MIPGVPAAAGPRIPGPVPVVDPRACRPRIDIVVDRIVVGREIAEAHVPIVVPAVVVVDFHGTRVVVRVVAHVVVMTLSAQITRMIDAAADVVADIIGGYEILRILKTRHGKVDVVHRQEGIAGHVIGKRHIGGLMMEVNFQMAQIERIGRNDCLDVFDAVLVGSPYPSGSGRRQVVGMAAEDESVVVAAAWPQNADTTVGIDTINDDIGVLVRVEMNPDRFIVAINLVVRLVM
jgi:hypothetical protein